MSKNLAEFEGWEQTTEELDFFGTTEEVVSYKPTEEVQEETSEKKKVEAPKDDAQLSFFGEDEEGDEAPANLDNPEPIVNEDISDIGDVLGDEGGDESEVPKVSEGDEKPLTGPLGTLAYLKEKGQVDYELEEGEELTEERAAEIIDENWENQIEERVGELFEDLPQAVKDLNKFALNGGDISQFFSALAKQSKVDTALDITVEANQELLARQSMAEEGYDDDYIQTQIEFLKDSKKLENFAKAKQAKLEEKRIKAQEALVENQKIAKRERAAKLLATKKTLASNLKEVSDVKGITLSTKDKKELPTYMVDRNVKLENGTSITGMQKDLMEALQDEKKALFIAKLLRTDFDLSEIQSQVESKITKKVKDGIRRNESNSKAKSTGSGRNSGPKKSLYDYF